MSNLPKERLSGWSFELFWQWIANIADRERHRSFGEAEGQDLIEANTDGVLFGVNEKKLSTYVLHRKTSNDLGDCLTMGVSSDR